MKLATLLLLVAAARADNFTLAITQANYGCTSEDGGGSHMTIYGDQFTVSGGAMDGSGYGPCGLVVQNPSPDNSLEFLGQVDLSTVQLEFLGGWWDFTTDGPLGDGELDITGSSFSITESGDVSSTIQWSGNFSACVTLGEWTGDPLQDCFTATGQGSGFADAHLVPVDGGYRITDLSYGLMADPVAVPLAVQADTISSVPEPGSLWMLAGGLVFTVLLSCGHRVVSEKPAWDADEWTRHPGVACPRGHICMIWRLRHPVWTDLRGACTDDPSGLNGAGKIVDIDPNDARIVAVSLGDDCVMESPSQKK